jgi:tRNA (cmo5U34)-methyltransferase
MSGQFHFDPETYLEMVRAEVPEYDRLQAEVAAASAGVRVSVILDLGSGVGTTARHVLDVHPDARLVGVDESDGMLVHARRAVPSGDFVVGRLQDELPAGPFDLIVSALAIHHLDGAGKADLFGRLARALGPAGRFVMGDVVVPDDPVDAITPLDEGYDQPSRVDDQLRWLADAGFDGEVVWQARDLAVIRADRR